MIAAEFEDNSGEEEEMNMDIGKFNPPEIFHVNIECKRMLVQLIKDFRVKPSVAAFSLLATNFKSCDAALNFISDVKGDKEQNESQKMIHPFIGCLPTENAN